MNSYKSQMRNTKGFDTIPNLFYDPILYFAPQAPKNFKMLIIAEGSTNGSFNSCWSNTDLDEQSIGTSVMIAPGTFLM